MENVSPKSFGVVTAYIVPGFICLWGISMSVEPMKSMLVTTPKLQPSVGGLIFTSIFSLALGLFCSTIRWLIIDSIHHKMGIRVSCWDFSKLGKQLDTYRMLEENHYRYYQFYGNSLVACCYAYFTWRVVEHSKLITGFDLLFLALMAVLFLGSRDTLKKYYLRVEQLMKSAENTA